MVLVHVETLLPNFLTSKLEWPEDYAIQKILPLMSMYDMQQISKNSAYALKSYCLRPIRYSAFRD